MTSWANEYGFIEAEGDAPTSWTEMVTINSSPGDVAVGSPETNSYPRNNEKYGPSRAATHWVSPEEQRASPAHGLPGGMAYRPGLP